jgi:hypothetical protein
MIAATKRRRRWRRGDGEHGGGDEIRGDGDSDEICGGGGEEIEGEVERPPPRVEETRPHLASAKLPNPTCFLGFHSGLHEYKSGCQMGHEV